MCNMHECMLVTTTKAFFCVYQYSWCMCTADCAKTTGQGQRRDLPNTIYVCWWKRRHWTKDRISKWSTWFVNSHESSHKGIYNSLHVSVNHIASKSVHVTRSRFRIEFGYSACFAHQLSNPSKSSCNYITFKQCLQYKTYWHSWLCGKNLISWAWLLIEHFVHFAGTNSDAYYGNSLLVLGVKQ